MSSRPQPVDVVHHDDGGQNSARGGNETRRALMADLTRRIRTIEQARPGECLARGHRPTALAGDGDDGRYPAPSSPPLAPYEARSAWTFGHPALESRLAPTGFDEGATYEIKPTVESAGGPSGNLAASLASRRAAAQTFAMMLAIRRQRTCHLQSSVAGGSGPPVLWCVAASALHEIGRPHAHGLLSLGFDPAWLVIAAPPRARDALWAAEEGLKSESLALVVLAIDDVAPTPARRLALAARAHHTPCLLLTHPDTEGAVSTLYRWRLGPAASAPHPFDTRAPGAPRLAIALERARNVALGETVSQLVEWSDEAHRFRMAAGMATRPSHAVDVGAVVEFSRDFGRRAG